MSLREVRVAVGGVVAIGMFHPRLMVRQCLHDSRPMPTLALDAEWRKTVGGVLFLRRSGLEPEAADVRPKRSVSSRLCWRRRDGDCRRIPRRQVSYGALGARGRST